MARPFHRCCQPLEFTKPARHVELFRLDYPIETAQAKVMEAGLPPVLAKRLSVGR